MAQCETCKATDVNSAPGSSRTIPPAIRSVIATVIACIALGIVTLLEQPTANEVVAAAPAADVLQSGPQLQWYRGNMHTHSLWSDGDDYPEMIALWYREHEYDFLVFTDHNVLADVERWSDVLENKGKEVAYDKLKKQFPDDWVEERTVNGRLQVRLKKFSEVAKKVGVSDKFLLVQGEEITDRFKNFPIHMNVTNVQELIPPMRGESVYDAMQNNVNAAIAQRERVGKPSLIHLNHPNFYYGVTAEDLMRVRGENFFEVYNGHPDVNNSGDKDHASTEKIWDIILTHRIVKLGLPLMYGLATDDGHSYHKIPSRRSEPGRGWVMVLAADLSPESIIDAMEQGRFYASSGVSLERVESSPHGLNIEVASIPGVSHTIEFFGTKKGFDDKSEPIKDPKGRELPLTRKYSDDIGQLLKTVEGDVAEYQFSPDDLYVRARITSTRKHPNPSEVGDFERAWVQPVMGPAGREFSSN